MTDAARLIMILDRLPKLLELAGEAGERIARATFSGVAAPLGNIDSIHIVDMGGNGKGLDQLSTLVPNTVFKTIASLKASGVDLGELARKAGIDLSGLSKMVGPLPGGNQEGRANIIEVVKPAPGSLVPEEGEGPASTPPPA